MKRFIVLLMLSSFASSGALPPAVAPQALPFPLTQVRLLDGQFKRAMELDAQYLLSLDPDQLLHTFRLTAGLPTTAKPLGGWEKPDCGLRGHFTGHYLSACALMFESTGNPQFRERANRVVAGLAECQQALGTGYLSAFPATAFDTLETKYGGAWAPYYTIHKIMAGLLEVHRACGNPQALEMAKKMADYFNRRMAKLTPEQLEKVLHTNRHAPQNEFGGMSEVLHNLYALTGRPEDLNLANRFDRPWLVDPLAAGTDILQGLHANTHIPQALGWWSHYRMTGETRYRDAALFFWQQVARHRSYVTGDNSKAEHFFPLGQEAAQLSPDTAESCNVYNLLKLTRELFAGTPNPEYADFYERALFNHILGSIDPDDGMTMYFLSLKPGHFKVYGTPLQSFWCCTGTGLENHAKYADSIYFHDAAALWVNLFIASEVHWTEKGLTLRQETKFPAEEGTTFRFKLDQPADLTLNLRIPEWATGGVKVKVNGKLEPLTAKPHSYLALKREWKDGDSVELSLPLSLRVHHAIDDPATVALLCGPIVLAGELGREDFPVTDHVRGQNDLSRLSTPPVPALVDVDLNHPAAWLQPVPGKPLTFRTVKAARPADLTLSPLYALHHQRYTVYWKTLTAQQWSAQEQELRKREGQEKVETTEDELARAFKTPPDESKPWVYWWWLNGNASQAGITRDFQEMKQHGIGGALLFDAGEAGPEVPGGPPFMSEQWRELFKYAVREADRFGIVLTVNLCSGWDCGGPWVTPEHAAKKLVSAQTIVNGPGRLTVMLPRPQAVRGFYRDIAVLAQLAAADKPGPSSVWQRAKAVDVTGLMDSKGQLVWDVPAGRWQVLRLGCTLTGRLISNPGSGPAGLEIDPLSAEAMDLHFAQTGARLIADAGPLAGRTLQYFHIDSWEIGQPTWTPRMREEFQRRRGYDPLPWLPAVLGQTVDTAAETRRFMQDYRRTFSDLVAANYYGRLQELSVKGGLRGAHSEAGGPIGAHYFWADALENLGANAVPMGEFWARNSQPNGAIFYGPHNHTLKEIASAAHSYGKPLCQAEAFTSLADDFSEDPWSLKDIGDSAFCDGLTRMVFHNWPTHLNPELKPGYWWTHIGTHFGYNLTWWPLADGWLSYLARCQHLLRQGLFVADFACLQNEAIPNFVARRSDQQPRLPDGFDYDALNAEVVLTRASASNGCLTLPDGMSYRYLVLPHQPDALLSPATLKKVNELAAAGVPVLGPKAFAASVVNLRDGPVQAVTRADSLAPDLEFRDQTKGANFEWIHRRDGATEIYFISNQGALEAAANVLFRVAGKQPELWDAVSGRIRDLPQWQEQNGRTLVPLQFAPRQSWFVVFRKPQTHPRGPQAENFPNLIALQELTGGWEVAFDPKWGGPERVTFQKLADWTTRPEEGIRCYSGIATYRKTFDVPLPVPRSRLFLDLGLVKNLARVRLNGHDLGVVWTAPWQVDITDVVREKANELEIDVVNLWPNRLIGDASLPKDKRRSVSNIATYDPVLAKNWSSGSSWARSECPFCSQRLKTGKPAELLPSGLLGPVTLRTSQKRADAHEMTPTK